MSKDLIILGLGPTAVQCDYHCETWSVNSGYRIARRLDKLFVMDHITTAEFDFRGLAQVKEIVASVPYPEHPEWNVTVYPIKEILDHFKTRFFSNAICYMMAYALYQKYERIYFYGIDMMTNSTYLFEKGGVEYWMGIAHALGVPVINTRESCTGKTLDGKMYGYWGPGNENISTISKCVADEAKRLIKNFDGQVAGSAGFDAQDPHGELQRKNAPVLAAMARSDNSGRKENDPLGTGLRAKIGESRF